VERVMRLDILDESNEIAAFLQSKSFVLSEMLYAVLYVFERRCVFARKSVPLG
jgi:hypothetical protein